MIKWFYKRNIEKILIQIQNLICKIIIMIKKQIMKLLRSIINNKKVKVKF